jgi:hypothetical protein
LIWCFALLITLTMTRIYLGHRKRSANASRIELACTPAHELI